MIDRYRYEDGKIAGCAAIEAARKVIRRRARVALRATGDAEYQRAWERLDHACHVAASHMPAVRALYNAEFGAL